MSEAPAACRGPRQPSLPGHTPPAPRLHVPCWTHRSLPAPGLHPPCWTQCRVLPYGGPHLRRIHTQRPVHGESSLMLCWVVTGREGTARTCPQAVGTKVQNTHIHSLHHPGRLASSSAAASGACLPRCWWQPSCWTRRRPASWGCTRSWARVRAGGRAEGWDRVVCKGSRARNGGRRGWSVSTHPARIEPPLPTQNPTPAPAPAPYPCAPRLPHALSRVPRRRDAHERVHVPHTNGDDGRARDAAVPYDGTGGGKGRRGQVQPQVRKGGRQASICHPKLSSMDIWRGPRAVWQAHRRRGCVRVSQLVTAASPSTAVAAPSPPPPQRV